MCIAMIISKTPQNPMTYKSALLLLRFIIINLLHFR